MNLDFWKNLSQLWSKRDNIEDYKIACEKGKIFGKLLNSQESPYNDSNVFDYADDDDEDGI